MLIGAGDARHLVWLEGRTGGDRERKGGDGRVLAKRDRDRKDLHLLEGKDG